MTDFTYTDDRSVLSSAVDDVYFNANDNTLVIDWNDEMYRYSGVTQADYDAVVAGTYGDANGSVGRACIAIKQKFGPGEYLGHFDDVEGSEVDKRSSIGVPKDLREPVGLPNGPTREYSLQTPVAEVNIDPATDVVSLPKDEPTREFSLQTPRLSVVEDDDGDDYTIDVYFTLDGSDKEFVFGTSEASDVDEALEELSRYVSRIGENGKVRKVVLTFAD